MEKVDIKIEDDKVLVTVAYSKEEFIAALNIDETKLLQMVTS